MDHMPMAHVIQWQAIYFAAVREYPVALNYPIESMEKVSAAEEGRILNG